MTDPIRITIADDHDLFIEGLKLIFDGEGDFQLVAIAKDGRALLESLKTDLPDILLLDINMPKMSGIDAMKYIGQSLPNLKTIMLSTYTNSNLVKKAAELGASAYLSKNCNVDELKATIKKVHAGSAKYFPDQQSIQSTDTFEADIFSKRFELTKRELEVLLFIKEGHTNNEIAERLYLSVYTVETHRKNIMQKLNLKNPAALIKFIYENGM